jgi:hypothetical protein
MEDLRLVMFELEVRQTLSHLDERGKKFARTFAAQPKSITRMKDSADTSSVTICDSRRLRADAK